MKPHLHHAFARKGIQRATARRHEPNVAFCISGVTNTITVSRGPLTQPRVTVAAAVAINEKPVKPGLTDKPTQPEHNLLTYPQALLVMTGWGIALQKIENMNIKSGF